MKPKIHYASTRKIRKQIKAAARKLNLAHAAADRARIGKLRNIAKVRRALSVAGVSFPAVLLGKVSYRRWLREMSFARPVNRVKKAMAA